MYIYPSAPFLSVGVCLHPTTPRTKTRTINTTHQNTRYRQSSPSLSPAYKITWLRRPAQLQPRWEMVSSLNRQLFSRRPSASIPSLLDAAGNVVPVSRSRLEGLETTETAPFCEKAFRPLVVAAEKGGEIGVSHSSDIWELRDRFQQWASKCGALLPANSPRSLERQMKSLRNRGYGPYFRRLLGHLAWSLQSATDIAEGRRPGWSQEPYVPTEAELQEFREMFPGDSDSDSDSDCDSATGSSSSFCLQPTSTVYEIDQAIKSIKHRITSLSKAWDHIESHRQWRGMN